MSRREWTLLGVAGCALAALSIAVGIGVDRLVLGQVLSGPPQRLAAAMAGLFGGGLIFFGGMIAWFVRRSPE